MWVNDEVKKLKSEIRNDGIKLHKVYVENNTNTSTPEKDKSIFPEQNVSTKNIQLGYGDGYVLPNGGITSQILRLIEQQNGNHHQKREISMISQILKSNKPEVYALVMKNNSAKSLLKQIDGIWKWKFFLYNPIVVIDVVVKHSINTIFGVT